VKLAVALAVLFFASQAHADSVPSGAGPLYIPSGNSTVTSMGVDPNCGGGDAGTCYIVYYSFSGGTSDTIGNEAEGYGGTIDFSGSVSDVECSWAGYPFIATDNVGDDYQNCGADGFAGTATSLGPGITELQWQSGDIPGGITALDPKSDSQSVPEPSTWLPLVAGVVFVVLRAVKTPKQLAW
jgi:hypothetical protein